MAASVTTAFRGRILHCLDDPGRGPSDEAVEYFADGVLLVDDGRVAAVGPADTILPGLSQDVERVDHSGRLLLPGLIDCHVHYPQTDMIASYGCQLLDWLNDHTYPAEQRFADDRVAAETAAFFLDELLRNGTTTALVFATVHPHSAEALFAAAAKRRMRLATGKVLMDRNCPEPLRDTAEAGYRDSRALLTRWHGRDRLRYAITPRFAPTSSDAQLTAAGRLAAEYPDALVHTHLAENRDEVDWVRKLYPGRQSYLDVYRHFGLLRERSVFAHCLHLDDGDHETMAAAGGAMAFCPTSNLFLGSGLFDLQRARDHGVRVGIGTDVGGGTSFNLLRTLGEAYKVLQLRQQSLSSLRGLYLATLGAAEALYMDDAIGNFAPGKEADFIVLDHAATPLIERRIARTHEVGDELFVQMLLGDDRSVAATYILGRPAFPR